MREACGYRRHIESIARELGDVSVQTAPRFTLSYGFDATGYRGRCDGVAYPRGLEDLARIVRAAWRRRVPLFVRGAGSGFSGGAVPQGGGLVVSTEHMHRVLSFDGAAGEVEVEAGCVNKELQDYLGGRGCFYPPDPASLNFSTIGGNIAENAGGPRAFKYGVTRRYVRSLTWITASGGVVERAAPAGSTALLIGSEGTLGAIYAARLAVLPMPAVFRTALLEAGPGGALSFAAEMIAAGLTPSVLEYIDARTLQCVGEYCCFPGFGVRSDCLFIEFDGDLDAVEADEHALREMVRRAGLALRPARDADEREFLWKLRRSVSPSLARRGVTKVNEDVSLPLGRLADAARGIHELAREEDLDCYLFGHAGDGNLHVNIMTDRRRAEEMRRVHRFVERLFELVVSLGGCLSGEHGIGITKSPYLGMIFTPVELEIARGIKRAMDPEMILNPGKYFMAGAHGGGKAVAAPSGVGAPRERTECS
jgi:glycolate oxidase